MSTQLRVVTWNAEGMFVKDSKTRRASPKDGIAVIKRLDADVIFIPEFGDTARINQSVTKALRALGYETIVYSYNQPELGTYGAALISRIPIATHVIHSFSNTNRSYIEAYLRLPQQNMRIFGLHLDDRSEKLRLQQMPEVVALVNEDPSTATIVLGDFNAMHRSTIFARIARSASARFLTKCTPFRTLKSVMSRVTEMAQGTTIELLLDSTDLKDLDGKHRRTISARQAGLEWLPSLRLAKIDWLFGSHNICAKEYRVLPDVGSDHRPILTVLDVAADTHY